MFVYLISELYGSPRREARAGTLVVEDMLLESVPNVVICESGRKDEVGKEEVSPSLGISRCR